MKKYLVVIAVLAMSMFSTAALADITFDGSVEFLMRSVKNVEDINDATTAPVTYTAAAGDTQQAPTGGYQDTFRQTYERVRFGINAKNDGVKARIQIENDWDTWADNRAAATATAAASNNPGFETRPNGTLSFREAWLDFTIPGAGPAHVKVGRQFLQLGNGWFFRSGKYGSDAWLVGLPGKNTIAFVNMKAAENEVSRADDTDAYVLLDNFKLSDTQTVGAYIAHVLDRRGNWAANAGLIPTAAGGLTPVTLDNIGLWFNGKVGPVNLQAELDIQMGSIDVPGGPSIDLSGKQFVLQATMPIDALTVNATFAMGTGDDPNSGNEVEAFLPFLDKDPHFTLVYEYFLRTAAGSRNMGFSNTNALGVGAMYKINKMFAAGADFWMFTADQKDNVNGGAVSDKVGSEVDLKLNVTLYDQLTWNTVYGTFMPGKMYENAAGKADNVTAVQSVLSYKF